MANLRGGLGEEGDLSLHLHRVAQLGGPLRDLVVEDFQDEIAARHEAIQFERAN